MQDIYTVGERCPLGCLAVVLVKRVTDGLVFAWCGTCGLAWADPIKETWLLGDHGSAELHASAIADGDAITLATRDDVERLNLASIARPVAPSGDWPLRQINDYNNKYGIPSG